MSSKTYYCEPCCKKFLNDSNLNRRNINIHGNGVKERFQCEICVTKIRTYSTIGNLIKHKNSVHSNNTHKSTVGSAIKYPVSEHEVPYQTSNSAIVRESDIEEWSIEYLFEDDNVEQLETESVDSEIDENESEDVADISRDVIDEKWMNAEIDEYENDVLVNKGEYEIGDELVIPDEMEKLRKKFDTLQNVQKDELFSNFEHILAAEVSSSNDEMGRPLPEQQVNLLFDITNSGNLEHIEVPKVPSPLTDDEHIPNDIRENFSVNSPILTKILRSK